MSSNPESAMTLQMPKLEWTDEYAIGISTFDNQHKVLFEFINDLRDIMMSKRTNLKAVDKTFLSILDYTLTHFLEEEIFLYKISYPNFNRHKKDHDNFIREVKDLYVRFKAGEGGNRIICAEITAILTEWIQGHIMKDDLEYAKFASENGVSL